MSPRLSIAALAVALSLAGAAQAQIYYPQGYGGYGWSGWGGGATPPGDIARGMGAFAAGAGYYNQETAVARSINADTAVRWNQYWYEAQQEHNRKYYTRLAEKQKTDNKALSDIYLRLRDNPNQYDVYRGDALNVIYDELCSPKVYIRGLKSAGTTFPGEMIRDVPFQYAAAAVTNTVHNVMTKGSAPAVLRKEPFKADLDKLRAIATKFREEDQSEGRIDPETLDRAQALIKSLQDKVTANLAVGTKDRTDSDRFLKSAMGLCKMLHTPAINVLLAGVDKHPETTVGDLLIFMKACNLRFGAADSPRQKMVYDQLYPLLVKLRDEAFPKGLPAAPGDANPNPESATEFLSGMEAKAVDPNAVPPPPRPQ